MPNAVYDDQDLDAVRQGEKTPANPGQAHYDEQFRHLTSPGHQKKDGVSGDKGGAAGAAAGAGAIASKVGGAAAGGGMYREEGAAKGFRSKLSGLGGKLKNMKGRTKAGIGGALLTGGIGLGAFFGAGSLQAVHLSQILSLDNIGNEQNANISMSKLFRYARSGGDVGSTRVSWLGERKFRASVAELDKVGVSFEYNKRAGLFQGTTIDTRKYPGLKGVPQDQVPGKIAEIFKKAGIDPSKIEVKNGKATIPNKDLGISARRAIVNDSIANLEGGKISTWLQARQIKKFYNLPSIFHPFKRVDAKINEKLVTRALQIKEDKARKAGTSVPDDSKAKTAYENFKNKTSGVKAGASAVLLVTAVTCIARDAADEAIELNRQAIVIPQVAAAADAMAVGAQQQSGMDFAAEQISLNNQLMSDPDGKDIWQAKALQAKTNPDIQEGEDLPDEYAQAFGDSGGANELKNLGGTAGEAACSPLGQAAQVALGLAVLGASLPTGGGAQAGYFALKTAGGAAAGAAGFYALQQAITSSLTNGELPEDLTAPVRGNLLAYGSREMANVTARGTGGVELSDEESAALDSKIAAEDRAEFKSRPLFAQLFDARDYRSITGSMTMKMSTPQQSAKQLATSFMNLGATLANSFGSLMPRAHAADKYDYGFNRFGIPKRVQNNPEFADPYVNGKVVAGILEGSEGQGYIDRMKNCFGVAVANDSEGGWSVTPEEEVNPNSTAYDDANCDQSDSLDWDRMIKFVNDSSNMEAAACYLGDEDACEVIGMNDGSQVCGIDSSTGSGETTSVKGMPSWVKMPVVNATPGGAVNGNIDLVIANIKEGGNVAPSLKIIAGSSPDFIGLNEVGETSLDAMRSAVPSYDAYRYPKPDTGPGTGQRSMDNAIMYRKDTWQVLDGGRIKTADDDKGYNGGSPFVWDRWAAWAVFKNKKTNAVVPVIITHAMTNPAKFPKQHDNPPMTRIEQYGLSMDILIQLVGTLSKYGPVLVAGDMNTHSDQGGFSAVPKMKSIGYGATDDGAVIYVFNPQGTKVQSQRGINIPIGSDHGGQALGVKIDMNGAGPGATSAVPEATTTETASEDCSDIGTTDYQNPVYKDAAPDPSVVRDDDGMYHVFATGKVHLTSKDLVHWNKVGNDWNLKGAPNQDSWWAPDVAKIGSKYVLTYAQEGGSAIRYATASSPSGPFNYQGEIPLGDRFTIDPQIFVDGDKSYFVWGGGYISISEVKLEGDKLKLVGFSKELLTKRDVGSSASTIENPWIYKHDSWYYLMYSQGNWKVGDTYPYQVAVARSKSPMGSYEPDNTLRVILKGAGAIKNPGGNSVAVDDAGKEWAVYHGYYKGSRDTRSLMIDPISYQGGWPVIDGPSDSKRTGPSIEGLGGGAGSVKMSDDYDRECTTSWPGQACDGQCVDFVKFRLKKHIDKNKFATLGNGKDVVNTLASTYGYKKNNIPAVNAVASWPAGGIPGSSASSSYGHTAMVSKVNPDGSIVVEQYNVVPLSYSTSKLSAAQAKQLTYAHTEKDFK